jgi:hypothetical protein
MFLVIRELLPMLLVIAKVNFFSCERAKRVSPILTSCRSIFPYNIFPYIKKRNLSSLTSPEAGLCLLVKFPNGLALDGEHRVAVGILICQELRLGRWHGLEGTGEEVLLIVLDW